MTQSDVVRISIRFQPRASRYEVAGWQESGQPSQSKSNEIALAVRVSVRAAAVDGACEHSTSPVVGKAVGCCEKQGIAGLRCDGI